MKRGLRAVGLGIAFALIAVLGLLALIRLAPADVSDWHVDLAGPHAQALPAAPGQGVIVRRNGAYADLPTDDAQALLAQIDALALATPRTRHFAGSVAAGHITWESRSLLWGFPDYTTAQITPSGLRIYARQRFGTADFGVNAARLTGWLAGL